MYDSDGRSAGTVTGDTSIGIMGQAMTITAQRGRDAAEKSSVTKKSQDPARSIYSATPSA